MKKALYTFMMAVTLVSVLVACQKKDDDSGNGNPGETYAATPTPNPQQCGVPGGICTQNQFQQYPQVQFQDYQWTNNGFCGCQYGYRPVMNANWGISCAPNSWMQNYSYMNGSYFSFSFQATAEFYFSQNGQWSSIPQVTYSPAVANHAGGNCYNQAVSVCDTRSPNSCPNGGFCRATAGGSFIGLCTNDPGIEHYSAPPAPSCWIDQYGYRVCTSVGYGYGYGYKPQSPGFDGRNPR